MKDYKYILSEKNKLRESIQELVFAVVVVGGIVSGMLWYSQRVNTVTELVPVRAESYLAPVQGVKTGSLVQTAVSPMQ